MRMKSDCMDEPRDRRQRCKDCPLVGEFCHEHHEMIAQQSAKMDLMKNRMSTFFTIIGVVIALAGGLMSVILGFLRADTAAIRHDISDHMAMHVQGTFLPSRDAEPRRTD